jgi:hypothetical protein
MGDALLTAASAAAPAARFSGMLLALVWAGELAGIVRPHPALSAATAALLGAFLLLALARASRHIRVLFVVVAGVSAALAWKGGVPEALVHGYRRSQIFGAFLPSVLLLRATAEESPRLERLRRGLGALAPAAARNWTLYGSHALGAVLSVGAMSVLAPVVTRGAGDAERAALATSSARGVGAAVMWSPFFVAMGFSSQLVPHVAIGELMAIGAGLAAIGLAISGAMYTPGLTRAQFVASVAQLEPLLLPMAIVIAAVVGTSAHFRLPGLAAVALVVPICCAAYLAMLGAASASAAARRTLASFARLADELLIVSGATILATVVAASPFARTLAGAVTPGEISGFGLIAALVFVLYLLGLAGLHPMIGVGILLPVIAAGSFGITHGVLVETGVFAWGLSASISMWSLPIVTGSLSFGVPVRDLVKRRDVLFGIAYGLAGVVYLGAVNAIAARA